MTLLRVDPSAQTLTAFGRTISCNLGGRDAVPAADKREGDSATPRGVWPILGALLRPDRVRPMRGNLPWRWLRPDDGWSDDPADPAYNRPVRHPHRWSAERLWRGDRAYDAIVILGHNHAPPVPGRGSAIFLHCTNDSPTTAGCVAVARAELLALLPLMAPGDVLAVD